MVWKLASSILLKDTYTWLAALTTNQSGCARQSYWDWKGLTFAVRHPEVPNQCPLATLTCVRQSYEVQQVNHKDCRSNRTKSDLAFLFEGEVHVLQKPWRLFAMYSLKWKATQRWEPWVKIWGRNWRPVCLCVCVYACVHACMHAYVCVCVCASMCFTAFVFYSLLRAHTDRPSSYSLSRHSTAHDHQWVLDQPLSTTGDLSRRPRHWLQHSKVYPPCCTVESFTHPCSMVSVSHKVYISTHIHVHACMLWFMSGL